MAQIVPVDARHHAEAVLIEANIPFDKVWHVMTQGECKERGDLALFTATDEDGKTHCFEAIIKKNSVIEVYLGWSDAPLKRVSREQLDS